MNFPFYEQAPKEAVTECNCCGSKEYVLVATLDRYKLEAPAAKCVRCGLVFLSWRMTAEAYRQFYADGHYRQLLSEFLGKPVESFASAERSPYAEMIANFLGPYMNGNQGGLLLDLGGSTGLLADTLALAYNLDATVVEPSVTEAERARARGFTVIQVPIEEFKGEGVRYNLITLCRTIDHLLDIKGTLARIRNWLAPGGLFFVDYVTIPPTKIDHPYLLSRSCMKRYVKDAGFRIKVETQVSDGRHNTMLCEGV